MIDPKYVKSTLVEYSKRIYEVLDCQPSHTSYQYKLILRAFLTSEDVSIDFMPQNTLSEVNIEESYLQAFPNKPPRYSFEERVRWTDDRHETQYALVKYIQFENHRYMYRLVQESRKDEGFWMNNGHLIEEGYISK